MYIDLTPELRALRDELRTYFAKLMTPELVAELTAGGEGGGPQYRRAMKKMGKDGWLGVGWPKEYGGMDRTPLEQFLFADEIQRAGFPLPFLTLNTIGPTIMAFGTPEQKAEFLPRILAGELNFAIGYSEPGAGTDLASLTTSAVRDGDDWIIQGQKTFTSLADFADYIWLAARTDPDAKKHRGISMFIVPTSSPGFRLTPIWTVSDVRTNATFYDQVRVPGRYLVGGLNNGWGLITSQLNHERVSLFPIGPFERLSDDVRRWAQSTKLADGRRVIDQPFVRRNLARCYAGAEALRLMLWKQAWTLTHSRLHPAEASTVKVYASEFFVEAYRLLMEVIGPAAAINRRSPGAVLAGRLERMYRSALILTFGGGTNEVQRDIIAMAGLQMPHYKG
ncbi:MAG TPA: acyl-CoA dehydrogenase family protein [Myxococcota bacterium]|nr:acyl-CoA dehydrogenase family protein [Myxococcota bacterium]